MISHVPRRGVWDNEVETTHKRLEESESELNGDGGPRSTRLKSDSENLALRNRIKELEDKVDQLTVDVEEKTGMYVKKGGVVTIETTVSSVVMSDRQTQFVHVGEMTGVVSGDAREMTDSGLT